MKTLKHTAMLVLATSVAACSGPPAEPTQPIDTAPPEAGAPAQISADQQGILTDAQRATYNAANQASALLQEADEARRKQIDAQTR